MANPWDLPPGYDPSAQLATVAKLSRAFDELWLRVELNRLRLDLGLHPVPALSNEPTQEMLERLEAEADLLRIQRIALDIAELAEPVTTDDVMALGMVLGMWCQRLGIGFGEMRAALFELMRRGAEVEHQRKKWTPPYG